jgi:hypothetical protein
MSDKIGKRRLPRVAVLRVVLFGLVVVALALPAAGYSGKSSSAQAGELEVFSWWTGGGEAAGLTKVIGIWKKENPNIKFVNATVAGGAGTNAKAVLAQRLSANDPPDSFQGHAGAELQDYIKAGDLEPIDFLYRQAGFRKVMPKQLISQITYRGKLYSVPVNIHRANVLWFNPKVLRDAGVNGAPKTWGQFIAALKKADEAGVIPLVVGEQWTNKHLFETVLLSTLGPAKYAALWKGNGSWTSPGVRTAVRRYQALLEYTNRDAASLTWQDASKLVVDGKAAFNIMGDWANGYFTELHRRRVPVALRQLHAAEGRPEPRGRDQVADAARLEAGAGRVQPGQGLDPCPAGRERQALQPVPEVRPQGLEARQAGRVADPRRGREQRLEHRHRHGSGAVPPEQEHGAVPVRSRGGGQEVPVSGRSGLVATAIAVATTAARRWWN